VTPLTDLLQKKERGDKLSRWFNLSFWGGEKGCIQTWMVDQDTTGGLERREEETRDPAA